LTRAFDAWRIPTLFVSHDRNDVDHIADRVIQLDSGRMIGDT
jgi:ABC-type molybdate transport system ATPase subunit